MQGIENSSNEGKYFVCIDNIDRDMLGNQNGNWVFGINFEDFDDNSKLHAYSKINSFCFPNVKINLTEADFASFD